MERVSNQVTRALAPKMGPTIPQHYVCEYPRSGGTWLARMLADYFGIARPGPSIFPIGCRAVIHTHWRFHPKMRNVYVLMRDGRDVMTSYWFYRIRNIKTKKSYNYNQQHRELQRVLGGDYDPDNPSAHLADFMRHEFSHPHGAPQDWGAFYQSWYNPERCPWIAYLRYEDLLTEPVDTLKRAIEHITGESAEMARIERAVEHFSMAKDTGRKPGEEARTSFIRKGIAGDWKNYFTPEIARVFDELAGETLIKLGYEEDRSWVERFEREYEARCCSEEAPVK